MSRVLAAILVVCMGVVLSVAQEDKPRMLGDGAGSITLPFAVLNVDGKTAWRVSGRGTVRVEELVSGLATANGLRVSFSAAAAPMARQPLPYIGPDTGVVVSNSEIPDYVSEILSAVGLTMVRASTGRARVVTIAEAPLYALYVTEAELEALPASEWVMTRGAAKYANRATLDMVARSRPRGDGAGIVRFEDTAFIATGMAGEVRSMLRLIHDMDVPGSGDLGKFVRSYEVASGKANEAASVLKALFEEFGDSVQNLDRNVVIQTTRQSRINVAALPGTNKVVVRASAGDHSLVQAALEAMK